MQRGRVSRLETFGAADGPGVRYIVFFQGCPLRCAYCHNPETWAPDGGKEVAVSTVLQQVRKYLPYYQGGGITASGGEPLLQASFLTALFKACQKEQIHTVLDTAGSLWNAEVEQALEYTDLALLDVKFTNEADYKTYTGGSYHQTAAFLEELRVRNIPVWLRQVIVPGMHDNPENMERLRVLQASYSNVEKIELLPFRKLCVHKYQEQGMPFPLEAYPACSEECLAACKEMLL